MYIRSMKLFFTSLLLQMLCLAGFAQNAPAPVVKICGPSRTSLLNGEKPLYVIFSHGKTFADFDSLPAIEPGAIKAINIVKGKTSTDKYGEKARYGVIEVTIDDKKHPEVYKALKKRKKSEAG